jgi:hypothetical protein
MEPPRSGPPSGPFRPCFLKKTQKRAYAGRCEDSTAFNIFSALSNPEGELAPHESTQRPRVPLNPKKLRVPPSNFFGVCEMPCEPAL